MIVECCVTYNIKCELEVVIKRIHEANDDVTGRWIVMVTNKTAKPFWLVGYLLFMLMVGTNLPTPLYGVYKHQWGFSSGILTLIFAVYALTIIPSLLLFGPLSDRFGRKKVLLPGLIVAAIGSILFALAHDVTWLFIARAIQGLAVGL
jgi:MFS family permease